MNLTKFNQSDRCVYFSCPERSLSPLVYILLYVSGAAVVLTTVFGNLLVIISVIHFKQLHTPTNTLLLSLAVSDLLIGALLMPPLFIWIIELCWLFGRYFCFSLWLIESFLLLVSIYTITLISVDRYLTLSNPFFYTNKISMRRMCTMVYTNWFVCLGYSIALQYFSGNVTSVVMCPGECFYLINEALSVIDLVFSFIFPLSVIILLYTRVFVIAKKHATAIRELNNHTQTKTQKITLHSVKSERKAAKVLGILVSVFLMCLLPYFIYSLLGEAIELQTETFQKLAMVLFINSTINPFIYALFYPWFRRCFKIIITLTIFRTDSGLMNVFS